MVAGRLQINKRAAQPLWEQIEIGVRELVAAGVMPPGSLVASVRELAVELQVNPTVVAKAYQRLVESGVLQSRSWSGIYVADPPLLVSPQQRRSVLQDEARIYLKKAKKLGVDANTAQQELLTMFRRLLWQDGAVRFLVPLSQYRKSA
jgi:GntR family transcriptional regulator